MKQFEVFYEDLTSPAQHQLCRIFKTSPQEENWDNIPLAIIEREEEGG